MSVAIAVLKAQEEPIGGFENVIGYVIAAVVRDPDSGSITLEREIAVHADNAEDNQLAEQVVRDLQEKFEEAFPDPNKPQAPKIWCPE